MIIEKKWWKEAVVYQIYPRSFKDSNNDGIGDLPGITQKLDYIKSLGIDVVWLNPIFASPNEDNGYDISDYREIMPEFGTMGDFDDLLLKMHQRGLRLVLDLVVNHSSDEHIWFKESRKSRDNPFRNYYHWWPAEKGKPPYRWSFFDVKGDAWRYDKQTDSYYLHYFSQKQPDLNWENPVLRKEIYDIMNFWFEKGVDGFRMDVIPFISKNTSFPELPDEYDGDFISYYAKGPHLHSYLQEMNDQSLSKYDVMSVGEGVGVKLDDALDFVDEERNELNMFFHFDAVNLGLKEYKQPSINGWDLIEFKKIFSTWNDVFAKKGWGSIYLGNHDQPRMVSRWGNDNALFRKVSSKMLLTFLLTMRSTPYIYNGDELGMRNIRFENIEDYQDIEIKNWYKLLKTQGENLNSYMEGWKLTARDNGRTPFQWNNKKNAGFTNGKPWLPINNDYTLINLSAEETDSDSVLNYFRKMINLRKNNPVLVYGHYTLLDEKNPQIYVYTRSDDYEKWFVVLNFSDKKAATTVNFDHCELKLTNLNSDLNFENNLHPYESRVYKIV